MKRTILLTLWFIISIFVIGCKASNNFFYGDNHFFFCKYIDKNANIVENIKIPLIFDVKIDIIELASVEMSDDLKPNFHIAGYQKITHRKGLYGYVIILDLYEIRNSFVLESLQFRINGKRLVDYRPKSFIVVRTDYEVVDHQDFKLRTSILKYNNIPTKIKYQIDGNDYEVVEVKSLHPMKNWKILKEYDYTQRLVDFIHLEIEEMKIENPLYVNFNFLFNIRVAEKNWSYIDHVEINLLYIEEFERVIDIYVSN